METTIKTRIIVADDHEVFLDGLLKAFESNNNYEIVDVCRNGEQLCRSVAIHQPDVVLTDIVMPVMDGIKAIEKIQETHPAVACIVLTTYDNDHLIMDALEAGAMSFVNKARKKEEIFEAIESTLRGESYYCKSTTQRVLRLIANSRFGKGEKREDMFSEKEKQVIKLICEDKLVKEIASELCLGDRSVERYKGLIMEKMGVKTVGGIVKYAILNKLWRDG